jgi:hypothetical protein
VSNLVELSGIGNPVPGSGARSPLLEMQNVEWRMRNVEKAGTVLPTHSTFLIQHSPFNIRRSTVTGFPSRRSPLR